jgi:hypothetical protein
VLNTMLRDGAKRMLNELDPAPASLWDSGLLRLRARASADLDITGVKELRLLMVEVDSYDASRVVAGWFRSELAGPSETVSLASLVDRGRVEVRKMSPARKALPNPDPDQPVPLAPLEPPEEAVTARLPYEIVIPLPPNRFTRFRAMVTIANVAADNEIMPVYRAFVFDRKPNPERLVAADNAPPTLPVPVPAAPEDLVRQLYRHALSRSPSANEMRISLDLLTHEAKMERQGLQDLLWSLVISPEFQFIL